MSEKILAGLSEYHNLMLVINVLSCIAILYFLMKKHQKDNSQNVKPQNVKPQNVKPQNVKHLGNPKPSLSKKIKKKPRNLSWGIANNANLQMNMCEPVYTLYSVY